MALAGSMPPILRLRRSTQSGGVGMLAAAAWVVMYTENSTQAYLFCGAIINLTAMLAGDDIDIRVRKTMFSGDAWVNHSQNNYTDAQPATHPTIYIAPIPDVYGVEISARQNVGALRTLTIEVYDAKRLGLP